MAALAPAAPPSLSIWPSGAGRAPDELPRPDLKSRPIRFFTRARFHPLVSPAMRVRFTLQLPLQSGDQAVTLGVRAPFRDDPGDTALTPLPTSSLH